MKTAHRIASRAKRSHPIDPQALPKFWRPKLTDGMSAALAATAQADTHYGPLCDADAEHGKQLQVYASKKPEVPAQAGEYPPPPEWSKRDDLCAPTLTPTARRVVSPRLPLTALNEDELT